MKTDFHLTPRHDVGPLLIPGLDGSAVFSGDSPGQALIAETLPIPSSKVLAYRLILSRLRCEASLDY